MEFVQYRTGKDDEGRRLDKVLRILFPETPLSVFYSALRKGLIRVNDRKSKGEYRILSGDIIYVADFLEFKQHSVQKSEKNEVSSLQPDCIFKNEHILILNKPYDIPVHETSSYKGVCLNQIVVRKYVPSEESLSFTPGPLHRLDRKTTGLIAFSQSIQGAHEFTELLKKHEIKKYYLSVVDGNLTEPITFSDMLEKENNTDAHGFHKVTVLSKDETSSDGKNAVTTVRPLEHGSLNGRDITFVEVSIETGRTHQIRSQCAAHGYPLTGDVSYGGSHYKQHFLHAWRLEIPQPNALGLQNSLKAPLPESFVLFLQKYLPTFDISLYT